MSVGLLSMLDVSELIRYKPNIANQLLKQGEPFDAFARLYKT